MSSIRLAVVATAAAASLVVAGPAAAATKLVATVGPAFNISLTKGGKKVTTLKAGAYTITVRDRSNLHNFHLKGPGQNKLTTVAFVGTKTWNVSLRKGRYTFVCDPHIPVMKGAFTVK